MSLDVRSLPDAEARRVRAARLDRTFAALFLAQWLAAAGYAWLTSRSPGELFLAIVVSAAIGAIPTTLVVLAPGTSASRHAIAIAQISYGALFVRLTAGAFGTPFHVFASLALLGLYRSPSVVGVAAGVGVLGSCALDGGATPRGLADAPWIVAAALPIAIASLRARARTAAVPRAPGGGVLPLPPAAYELPVVITDPHALGEAPTLRPRALQELLIYSDLEGDSEVQELLDGFVGRLRDTARTLDATSAPAELEQIAQRLRGSAASFGFPAIGEAAAALEEAARAGADIAPRVTALAGLCRRARSRRLYAVAA